MRLARRPLGLVAITLLAACGTTTDVRSTRADPIDAASPASGPTDTTGSTDTTGPTGTSDTSQPSTSTLTWGACDDPNAQDPALQCATLAVPLDYAKPTGDTIDLALIRQPASGTRTGAVLFNPGGPGGSGFDPIAFSGSGFASALGIDSLDLIGFDPRGVDRSGGIHCVSDEFRDKHLYVDAIPDTPQEQALKDEAYSGYIDGCKQKYGDTLRLYSTENTARDMDAIRAALGDDQISYLGISYGTYLGATYATLFPDRVRAMVLDSVYEPNGDTAQQEFESEVVGFEGAFNNWVKWCQGETICEFKAADVGARWDALKQKLDDTPITAADGRVANNATMETATSAALYSESEWPVLGQALAKAENGDPAGILAIADSYEGRNSDGTFNTLFQSYPVIQCASGTDAPPPADAQALIATLRAAAPRFGKEITAEDIAQKSDRCKKLVGDTKPVTLSYSGNGPVVLIGGTNDPATPIRWAKKMVGELGPKATLVTYTGEGHGAFLVSNCVTKIEGALLADLKSPSADTTCEPDPVIPKPQWWDSLPVPDGVSPVTPVPALAAAVGGTSPTQIFSEMRTTTLSEQDAIDAYTAALGAKGFQQFDAPSILPIDGVVQGAYSDFGNRTLVIIALGPKAFDGKGLESAKSGVPANTTVLWFFAAG